MVSSVAIAWLASTLQLVLAGSVPPAKSESFGWRIEAGDSGGVRLVGSFTGDFSLTFSCGPKEDGIQIAMDVPYSEEPPSQDLTVVLMPSESALNLSAEVESHGNKTYTVRSHIDIDDQVISALGGADMIAFFGGIGGSGFPMDPEAMTRFLGQCRVPDKAP
jgi:hypothetical protein